MMVAVASSEDNLDAQMDPRFGRCAYIVVVDTDTMQFEAMENPGPAMGSGAGTSAAQIVGDSGAEAVVAGNFGPNAALALNAGGVTMLQASGMTVREAAEAAAGGELSEVAQATTGAKSGMSGQGAGPQQGRQMPGGGMGQGGGGGMGRGMGGGMGQGRCMGQGLGMGQPGCGQFAPQMGPGMMGPMAGPMGWGGMPGPMAPGFEEEMRQYHLSMLRAQADMLEQQLDFIQSQIEYLESQGE
jgi:predicted Fe-Mo cluster-binding NifX family protein